VKIAIIGTGNVGSALGQSWAKRGHEIVFGATNPRSEKVQKVVDGCGGRAHAASVAEAGASAPIIVLATPWEATASAIQSLGKIDGKILVDATNPLALGLEGLKAGLVVGHASSGAETISGWAKGARVVKAFNTIGAPNMRNPIFGDDAASMFICGDDAEAKAAVRQLSDDLGFATQDAGALSVARLLEPLAMLWIHLAYQRGWGTDFGFGVLRRA
jgi:8-hydroxy-5-deazaflavin:NADPH oxidoreductase